MTELEKTWIALVYFDFQKAMTHVQLWKFELIEKQFKDVIFKETFDFIFFIDLMHQKVIKI